MDPREAGGDTPETIVRKADAAELPQSADGGRKSIQLVDAQVERVELLQQTELFREDRQTVVAQIQNLQVHESADGHRELLQLQLTQ